MLDILAIYIALQKGAPMQAIDGEIFLANGGLEGDRYFHGEGAWSKATPEDYHKRQLTLFSFEDLLQGNQKRKANGLKPYLFPQTRRNILVSGTIAELEALVGEMFRIHDVLLEGTEICSPCARPAKLSGNPDFPKYFHGGIRTTVHIPGYIQTGDKLTFV